jgi:methyl-accepting chemotaxis protein
MKQPTATSNEITLDPSVIIVVHTNVNGIITDVNDDFAKISGYHQNEAIGQHLGFIHHPTMPTEIFADVWQSLGLTHPWGGVVKNIAKSGGYFWSHTNVIPEFSHGVVSNYLFVSYAPKKGELEKAQTLYNDIKNNTASLKQSAITRFLNSLKAIPLGKKTAFSLAGVLAPSALAGYELLLSQSYLGLAGVSIASIVALVNIGRAHDLSNVLDKSVITFYSLASKKFGNKFDLKTGGLVGDFYRGLFSMDVSLSLDIAESTRIANESLRIKNALDGVHSAVLVADANFKIIFANQSAQQLFEDSEADIKKQLPNFDTKTLLGSVIDIFHVNPKHQRDLLGSLTGYYAAEMTIGGHIMNVVANAVFNDKGEKIGYIAEWVDKTAEIQAIQNITNIIEAASRGNFETQISEDGQHGFLLELSRNLNHLFKITSSSLNEIEFMLEALSRGDLTKTITTEYLGLFNQIKGDVNSTVEKLREVIWQIQDTTEIINSSAKEIAAGNNDLSNRTERQAANLEQTAASIQELTSTVQHNSENAQYANNLAVNASKIASRGVSVVRDVVKTMEGINESSSKIVDIISVIDGIAFQTNILALNAAVEAARAGDQGRGFAVVATEVRSLAQRAASAAGEIKSLINDSVEKVEEGTRLVGHAGQTMEDIVSSVNGVTKVMLEISSASTEQTQGIKQVNQAIMEIDDVTQQNAALVEEAAAAAETLEDKAQSLAKTAGYFSLS